MAEKILESLEIKTGENTSDKYKLPYNVLVDPPDLSVYAKLAGNNTFTGGQTITGANNGYSINASGYIKGSWLQASAISNKGANTGKVCVFDDNGWIYYRTPAEILAEAGGAKASDVSGKLDKTPYEVNKTIDFGNSGALCIGKFKVYDTNVTCEITSTTDVTYSGKLVIATQNYLITQMTVYGDAANTVTPNIYIKPSSASDPYIEVYFKPANWSKNVIHIYGSAIEAQPTDVCTNVPAVPSTATSKPTNALNSKANLSGGNTFTGDQHFNAGYYGFEVSNSYDKSFIIEDPAGNYFIAANTDGFSFDDDQLGNYPFLIGGEAGTSGQVLTSQGAGKTPKWTTISGGSGTKTYSDYIYADDTTTIFENNEYGNAFIFTANDAGQGSRQIYSIYVNGVKTVIFTTDAATDYVDQAVCINMSRINNTPYSFINVNVFYKNTIKTIHINDVSNSTIDLGYSDDDSKTSSLYLNITKGTI